MNAAHPTHNNHEKKKDIVYFSTSVDNKNKNTRKRESGSVSTYDF